ncbi:MAG TPA: helix-turn-helix transcriptional regulator [Micromonosporaceae bacterium]|nr:helix-turn-helix transcriptional regulator [Micromonosporaceae bacterium]
MDRFGPALRRSRRQQGLSLRELGRLTNYHYSYLAQVERGERSPTKELATACDRALNAGDALLEAYGIGEEADHMQRRTVLQSMTTLALVVPVAHVSLEALRQGFTRVIDADHDDWQRIAADYGEAFYSTAPTELVEQLGGDLAVLHHRLVAAKDRLVIRDLQRAVGLLSVVLALTLAGMGQTAVARRWWSVGRKAADESGDHETQIMVRAWEVVNGPYAGRPLDEVITLADHAVALADGLPCAGTAGVLSGRAQALALAGRADEARESVRQAEEVTGRLPSSTVDNADSIFGWPEVRLRHTESYVYTEIGAVSDARGAQDRALVRYPASLARERTQVQLHQANCLIRSGFVTDGLRHAVDVLHALPTRKHNQSLYHIARRVTAVVPDSERQRPAVHELLESVRDVCSGESLSLAQRV